MFASSAVVSSIRRGQESKEKGASVGLDFTFFSTLRAERKCPPNSLANELLQNGVLRCIPKVREGRDRDFAILDLSARLPSRPIHSHPN